MRKSFSLLIGISIIASLIYVSTKASSSATRKKLNITGALLPSHLQKAIRNDSDSKQQTIFHFANLEALTSDTITVSEDAFLYQGNGSLNNGTTADLSVKCTADSSIYNRLSLLKFDLSGIDTSKGRITKAVLQLHISHTDPISSSEVKSRMDMTPYILGYLSDNSWQESTVTWNNYADSALTTAPQIVQYGSSIHFTGSTYPLTLSPNTSLSWDIANVVTAGKLRGAPLSLTLYSSPFNGNIGTTFYSQDYTAQGHDTLQPRLVLVQDATQSFLQPEVTSTSVYDSIMHNIRDVLYKAAPSVSTLDVKVADELNTITSGGSWPDINYNSTVKTNWLPLNHLNRLKDMALAYTTSNSAFFADLTLYQSIINGLQYWQTKNPISSNWYNQEIASPQKVGQILILMRAGTLSVPPSLEQQMLARMASTGGAPDQSGSQGTGANKLDIATHWIYRGCLTKNISVLNKGVSQAFYPLFLTSGEGVQYDYSYKQHGSQLYIGGYGGGVINGESSIALYTAGTSYTLPGSKLNILSKFVRETYLHVIRGHNYLFNVLGRGISRPGGLNQSGFVTLLNQMKQIDSANTTEYNQAIERLSNAQPPSYKVPLVHSHYFNSDYSLHTRPAYSFDTRMVSTRTARLERGNNENLKGFFMSDGGTNIAIDGTEYYNIFPVWDWAMIPGVTSRHMTSIPQLTKEWGNNAGITTFVGGVSDSLYGTSVYDLNNNNTFAKKSWFYFDDEVVCLGSGINSSSPEEINTTINQCLLSGPISISSAGSVSTYSGDSTSLNYDNNIDWVLHGKVGYVFPKGGEIGLKAVSQSGNWHDINTSRSSSTISYDVFTLWVKHGIQPTNNKYAYIVVPAKSSIAEMQSYTAADNIVIASNSDTIQAVYHRGLKLWQTVFYKSQSVFQNDSIQIATSKPCLLMLQQLADNRVMVHASDPSQSLSSVKINIKWPGISHTKQLQVQLPPAPYRGKSVAFILSNDSPDLTPQPTAIADTLSPIDDAYVRSGLHADSNYNTALLEVKEEASADYNRKAYLKFNLNDISQDKGAIQSVQLLLTVQSSGTGVPDNQFKVNFVDDTSWSETSITWNNRPAAPEELNSVPGKLTGTLSWDITDKVRTIFENNHKKLSLQITAQAADPNNNPDGWCGFYSKDSVSSTSFAPRLIVKFQDKIVPLQLIDFNGQNVGNSVLLNWHTAQEKNAAHIQILRGSTPHSLNIIDTLRPQRRHLGISAYQYRDKKASNGSNYYQLNIIDNKGKSTKSAIINLDKYALDNHNDLLKIAPNPARSLLKVVVKKAGKLQIISAAGIVMLEQMIPQNKQTIIDIHKLTPGIYFVKQNTNLKKLMIIR